ncbi:MAG: hypothetical protein NVS3B7_04340 [Candidatus Elarobacter sp.]
MEFVLVLLRIAARVAGGSVALVAWDGSDEPLAAWGCDPASARTWLRARRRDGVEGETRFAAVPVAFDVGDAGGRMHVGLAAAHRFLGGRAGDHPDRDAGLVDQTQDVPQVGSAHVTRCDAEQPLCGPVDELDPAVGKHGDHRVSDCGERR